MRLAHSRATVRLPRLRPATVFGAAALAVLAWAALATLARAAPILALAFLGALLGSVFALAIRALSPPLPRALATWLVLAVALGLLVGTAVLVLPTVLRQGRELLAGLPATLDQAMAALRRLFASRSTGDQPGLLAAALRDELAHRLTAALGSAIPLASAALAAMFGVFATVTVAGFLAYRPDVYVDGFLRLLPARQRPAFAAFVPRLGTLVQRWMLGALISMTVVGLLTGIGLWALDVEAWFALATLMFFAEFVPYLGPIGSGIAACTVALAESPEKAIWVAVLYTAVQQLEGNLVTPLVMKRVVRLQPALLLIWQLGLGVLFGLVGVLVATPLLVCVHLAVRHFYLEPREAAGRPPPPGSQGRGFGTTSGPSGDVSGPSGDVSGLSAGGAAGSDLRSGGGPGTSGGASRPSGPSGSGVGETPLGFTGRGPSSSTRDASNRPAPDRP
jgi:predicted PurR-regulated permease PerM